MRAIRALLFLAASVAILVAAVKLSPVVVGHGLGQKAQQAAVLSSPRRTVQLYVYNAGLWRIDRSFESTIRISNSLQVAPLDVVPVLYMADGTRYALPSVTLPTAGEFELNVNDALRASPAAVASHVSEFGSASLEYRYYSPGAVSGTIQILDLPRSLIFTNCFGPSGGAEGAHTVEGIWWKHDEDVTGFVSLTNTTSHSLEATLTLLGANGKESKERSFTLQDRTVQLVDFGEVSEGFRSKARDHGGIRVEYQGASGDLLVTAGLQNDATGYSASVPFLNREGELVKEAPHTYASVGMMVGKPDSMMSFPATTRFAPYAVLRNTTNKPLDVTSAIVYANGGQPTTVQVPLKPLKPFSTEDIDLPSLMATLGLGSLDGMINLTFTFNGRPGDLLIAAGSVDQTGNYVFEVHPEATKKSTGKDIPFWSVAGGSDTMISLWNPLESPQDIALTFRYADGSGQYRLPIHLAPKADTMISVAELRMMGQADINGEPFSPVVQEGSAALTHLADPRGEVTVVVSAGTFNVRTATCTGGCTLCRGTTSLAVSGAGSVTVGTTAQFHANAYQSDGNVYDVTGDSLWQTSNGSVVGFNGPGLFSGVAVGSAWITASYNGVVGGVCPSPPELDGGCQTNTFSDSVSVTVTPEILLGGCNGSNITGTTQSAVVGQQIQLCASYGSGVSVNSQSWSVPGTVPTNYVGDFNHSLTSGGYTQPTLNQQSTTFHWVTAATFQPVTFTLNYGNNQTTTAQATFNIAGPTFPNVNVVLGQVVINTNPGPFLQFGGTPDNIGIQFTASATPPPGYSNSFVWVQIITNDALLITKNDNTTSSCVHTSVPAGGVPELDSTYPYGTNNPTNDNPRDGLDSTTSKELIANFSATMYLMWSPGGNSIPVPLGSVSWQWSGDAVYNATSQQWGVAGSSANANAFQSSNTYPSWTRYSDFSSRNCI